MQMNGFHRRASMLAVGLALGATVLQSCSVGGFISDCFGSDTISRSEYDDLNPLERLLYDENDCGRYTRRSNVLDDLGDLFD
ncbi:MAG: hypothetical protein D6744_01605 [Planctomycetota bacterium]|nr:MAG: hypothetical protein D6744_01605 [Planctomycetota bacterium]